MIVTKKALSRRTFLRGLGTALALPLLDAMIPADDRAGGDAGRPGATPSPGLCLHADGLRRHPLDAAGANTLDELSPTLSPLAPVKQHVTVITQPGTAQRLPRHACDLQLPRS